jgi:hypothetical protein
MPTSASTSATPRLPKSLVKDALPGKLTAST